jgi:3-oxoacyl-[acyl-carrier protein] reductase
LAELKAAGGQAIAVQEDVTDPGDVENLFKETLATFGGIDVVVQSVGIMPLLAIAGSDISTFDFASSSCLISGCLSR